MCCMLEVPPTPHPPPPQMDISQSMSAVYKIATDVYKIVVHFCLDKAAVLNDFPRSALILDQTASI